MEAISIAMLAIQGLTGAVIALIAYTYKSDFTNSDKRMTAMLSDLRSNKIEIEIKLEKTEARLLEFVNDRFEEVIDRIESKLLSISEDTKKIPGIDKLLAETIKDIEWIKRN